jgi:hypothetical protein
MLTFQFNAIIIYLRAHFIAHRTLHSYQVSVYEM